MKTATIRLDDIKDPDGWWELAEELGLNSETRKKHLRWGEYASLEIEIDENMRIVGGRVLPLVGE